MPTPSEVTVLPSPPLEASSSRASFTSCPPEEEREHHAPREERIDSPRPAGAESAIEDEHMTIQEPTPEPEAQPGASDPIRIPRAHDKAEHVEDVGATEDSVTLSAAASPEPSGAVNEGDARLVRSMSAAAISSSDEPLYLTFPREKDRVCYQ